MTDQQTLPPPAEVTGPGVYLLPADEYHARLELSSTGVRKLLPPSCPALFDHWRTHGQAPKAEFDMGSAAHRLVLGVGEEIAEIKADNWRSPKHRDEADEHRAAGRIPLLSRDVGVVHEMAERLREHPIASALFAPGSGQPETTLIWRDRQAGVDCRALLDWLPNPPVAGRRTIVADFKTCRSAAPDDIEKAFASFGYVQQADWYLSGMRALGLADETAEFVFVFQEKEAPYLVTVAQPDAMAMRLAARLNREGREIFADCTARGQWPAYSEDVAMIGLPAWYERLHGAGDDW